MNLKLKRINGEWWIVGDLGGDIGPYFTKAEAEDDLRGLLKFYANNKRWCNDNEN